MSKIMVARLLLFGVPGPVFPSHAGIRSAQIAARQFRSVSKSTLCETAGLQAGGRRCGLLQRNHEVQFRSVELPRDFPAAFGGEVYAGHDTGTHIVSVGAA